MTTINSVIFDLEKINHIILNWSYLIVQNLEWQVSYSYNPAIEKLP